MNNDILKLERAEEVMEKYCLIFSRHNHLNRDWLKKFKPKKAKMLFEEVYEINNKKQRYIFMNPSNWLNI